MANTRSSAAKAAAAAAAAAALSFKFPSHTVVAVFVGNLAITVLLFLALMQGIDGLPNSYPPFMRQVMLAMGGTLIGWYLLVHILTPLGVLPGLAGAVFCTAAVGVAGVAPLIFLPTYRDIVHETPQQWLIGLQTVRAMGYLLLSLFDSGLLPASYALPVGWGDFVTGISAPLMIHLFASKNPRARELGLLWNGICLAELFMSWTCGVLLLDSFVETRNAQKLSNSYLWLTVFLLPRFTVPMLMLAHGYSIWKLWTEKEERIMIWHEEEDDDEAQGMYGTEDEAGP
eukprot:TRINITY_DN9771_c0_g1_i1.p1 TRINITY_DN9771_c0_g1~~TRINITY_DN9771_c0_g1_i1.p1  ORF type:complete len:286 (+),score=31.13 TRINITY_DN9771_c0_g1_i1:270-1127(+)